MNVATVGESDIIGMDGSFDFNFDPPNTGEYVLVASSEETI
jgi:hypothetical protein